VSTAEVSAISETKHALFEFEGDIDVSALFVLVGTLQKFFGVCKPEELAVEFEMHGQQAAIHDEKNIFALAFDGANTLALRMAGDMRSGLRLRGDGVKDVNATDSPALDEGPECADDSFYFRKFRHKR
jgi:hypothetical protein